MVTIKLSKSDIMELIDLVNSRRAELLRGDGVCGYDDVEWEYYFSLAELEDKLVQ